MTILEEIAEYTKGRIAKIKASSDVERLKAAALAAKAEEFRLEKALKQPGVSLIAECKKASPSKGIIAEEFDYLAISQAYEEGGADAISCLTEPKYFLGSDDYLREIASTVKIPCLRKDFTVDEFMLYEAKLLGAAAVLLIVAILDKDELQAYLQIADKLGLSALVECHDKAEIKTALAVGARIIGVNNRNLKDFSVDFTNSLNLRENVPAEVLFVAESGIAGVEDAKKLSGMGIDAILVGEYLMKSTDKKAAIQGLKSVL